MSSHHRNLEPLGRWHATIYRGENVRSMLSPQVLHKAKGSSYILHGHSVTLLRVCTLQIKTSPTKVLEFRAQPNVMHTDMLCVLYGKPLRMLNKKSLVKFFYTMGITHTDRHLVHKIHVHWVFEPLAVKYLF